MDFDTILALLLDPATAKQGLILLAGAVGLKLFQLLRNRKVATVDPVTDDLLIRIRAAVKAQADQAAAEEAIRRDAIASHVVKSLK